MKKFFEFLTIIPLGIVMSGPMAILGTVAGLVIGFLIGLLF